MADSSRASPRGRHPDAGEPVDQGRGELPLAVVPPRVHGGGQPEAGGRHNLLQGFAALLGQHQPAPRLQHAACDMCCVEQWTVGLE